MLLLREKAGQQGSAAVTVAQHAEHIADQDAVAGRYGGGGVVPHGGGEKAQAGAAVAVQGAKSAAVAP